MRSKLAGLMVVLTLSAMVISGCGKTGSESATGLANPASVHCEGQGYTLEMRTDENGGQYGICTFPDGSECEEWAFYRGECSPASETATETPTVEPTVDTEDADTKHPADTKQPDAYPGWASYTNPDYGFAFRYPTTWTIEEVPAREEERGTWANSIQLRQGTLRLVVFYKRSSEDVLMGPSGLPAGDLEDRGTVSLMGQEVIRQMVVYEGKDKMYLLNISGGSWPRTDSDRHILGLRGALS